MSTLTRRALLRSAALSSVGLLRPRSLLAMPAAGEHLAFRAYRDGDEIGEHRLAFTADGARLQVAIDIRFDVRFAFLTVYSYRHQSRETWQSGRLVALDAITDDNGEQSTVRARAGGEQLVVEVGGGRQSLPAHILPTSYWHESTIEREQWLDTQSGRIVRSSVTRLGTGQIEAGGQSVGATHYRLRGDLNCELWYRDRQWTKLRFNASDGSTIDYVLQSARFDRAARFAPIPETL